MSHLPRLSQRYSLLCLLAVLAFAQMGCSLGIRRDYILDRNATYSADDPFERGLVYRVHTKHYGHYYNCDNEESKRYAPWIEWYQRPCDSQSCRRELQELHQSYDDAICRWKMGSCQICPTVAFPPGAGYGNEAELAAANSAATGDSVMAPAPLLNEPSPSSVPPKPVPAD